MALNDMADQGIPRKSLDQFYNHMAEMFAEQSQVQVLLEDIGWPVAEQPQRGDAASQVYWSGIRRQIGLGRIEGGHRALFRAAQKQYRYSQVLNALAEDFADPEPSVPPREGTPQGRPNEPGDTAAPPGNEPGGTSASRPYVIVWGTNAYDSALRAVRTIDAQAELQLAVQGQTVIAVDVNVGRSPERLEEHVRNVLGQGVTVETRWLTSPPHIISQLIGIGPDQREFHLNNVPSTAQVADVASAVLGEYTDSEAGPGLPFNAAVDHVRRRRFMGRLDVRSALGEAEIQDGDSLRVHRPAQAGVQEDIWRDAVVRVRSQLLNYAEQASDFTIVSMDNPDFPTRYDVAFTGLGFAPPKTAGSDPLLTSSHEVRITIDHDFPRNPPDVRWRSPIFHPNIKPVDAEIAAGWLCLGELADAFRPDLDFSEVCRMLADVAGYRNYELRTQAEGGEGYVNQAAVEWAKTPAGQQRIAEIGGTRWQDMSTAVSPRPTALVIKPVDEFPDDDDE